MTLHFAYGSNMSRARMRPRCGSAREIGTGVLEGYRFIITADGYASVLPAPGGIVHGLVWRLTPRDLAALDAYESLDTGLYRAVTLPVRIGTATRPVRPSSTMPNPSSSGSSSICRTTATTTNKCEFGVPVAAITSASNTTASP